MPRQTGNLLWLLVLYWATGCAGHWRTSVVVCTTFENVQQACREVLAARGYIAVKDDKNLLPGTWESDWQCTLYPLRRGGCRRQLRCEILSEPTATMEIMTPCNHGASLYHVRLHVCREVNIATHDFMSEEHAVWLADGFDTDAEADLIEGLEARWAVAKH
jgi:hypothetical protein